MVLHLNMSEDLMTNLLKNFMTEGPKVPTFISHNYESKTGRDKLEPCKVIVLVAVFQ